MECANTCISCLHSGNSVGNLFICTDLHNYFQVLFEVKLRHVVQSVKYFLFITVTLLVVFACLYLLCSLWLNGVQKSMQWCLIHSVIIWQGNHTERGLNMI